MYVCVCREVTEDEVKAAIDEGADTVEGVMRSCCAGDDCGACHGSIEALIQTRRADATVLLPLVRGRAA
jgi:bacterioferritin-associated ferredoxin